MKFSDHKVQPLWLAVVATQVEGGLVRLFSPPSKFLSTELVHSPATDSLVQLSESQPQIEGDVATWDDSTKLAVEVEVAVCLVWVLMITSMPLLARYLSGMPFTKTQAILATTMWVAIFGGLYLFTNVILFQSAHFTQIRPLNIIECIYLMSQVITTVGYGDITPAKPRGQVFVGMYVLISFFIIAMVVSDMVSLIMATAQKYQEKLTGGEHVEVNFKLKGKAKADTDAKQHGRDHGHDHGDKTKTPKMNMMAEAPKPNAAPLGYSFCFYAFFAITWIFFFHLYPGEGKTWFQATYMSIITLSTVGFGAFTPNTTGGMIFGSFWMIFGSAALVGLVGAFAQFVVDSNMYERFDAEQLENSRKVVDELKQSGKKELDETQFIRFTLLQKGLCTADDVDTLLDNFQTLSDEKDGKRTVCFNALEQL